MSWTDPRHDGAGTWQHTRRHENSITSVLAAFIAALLGSVLFIGLVVAGRAVMCSTHGNSLSYCPGWSAPAAGEPQP